MKEKPNPGSEEALEQGCTCPILDNGYGKGCYKADGFIISFDCQIHANFSPPPII